MYTTDNIDFSVDVAQPVYVEGGKTGILLIHGFTGSAAHMRKLADSLIPLGHTVMSINLPGHATTELDMANYTSDNWIEAGKAASKKLKETCEKVIVVGLSMGGNIALLLAEEGVVDLCVTISSPMATKVKGLSLTRVFAPVYKRIMWMHSPERHKLLDPKFDLGYSGFPTQKGYDLHILIKHSRRHLKNITCPILVIQSDADNTIWSGSGDYILENVSSTAKHKLLLSSVPHVLTISDKYPTVVNTVHEFIISEKDS